MAGIDINDPRPAHEQIAARLRDRIRTGELKPNDQLPTARQLATELGVSPMTINQAIRILRSEGLVVSRHGVGVFVRDTSVPRPPTDPVALAQGIDSLTEQVRALTGRVEEIADQLRVILRILDRDTKRH